MICQVMASCIVLETDMAQDPVEKVPPTELFKKRSCGTQTEFELKWKGKSVRATPTLITPDTPESSRFAAKRWRERDETSGHSPPQKQGVNDKLIDSIASKERTDTVNVGAWMVVPGKRAGKKGEQL